MEYILNNLDRGHSLNQAEPPAKEERPYSGHVCGVRWAVEHGPGKARDYGSAGICSRRQRH